MHSLKLLEEDGLEVTRHFIPYHNRNAQSPRGQVFQHMPRVIIEEHLSVKRVIADLRDMLFWEGGSAPQQTALPEPNSDSDEEVARDIAPTSAGRIFPEERALIDESIEKLFSRLMSQEPRTAGPAQTAEPARLH